MKMKSVLIREYGSNDQVDLAEVTRPMPEPGEVLIKVSAAGVNPIDWKIRSGAGQRMGMTLPIHLGSEVVGTVEAVGPGVDSFREGDLVYGMVSSGGFSEYTIAQASHLARTPGNLDIMQAAALPLAGTTAWQAMFNEAGLSAGQRLLITNSSGGVGSLAVQLAKAHGAHVIAVASGRNEAFVRGMGADEFIDYTQQPFEEAVRDVDVVLDTMGGDTFQRAFKVLRKGGRMVTIVAFPQDEAERFGVTVKRSFTRPDADSLREITALVERGEITPHVEAVFSLAEVTKALELSEAGRTRGKIVLTVG
ncbi:NADP-dependent oxidoreductase [Stenotrophomonas sp. 278]|uniref:NADP-dependent oxidoreductase n=1 Tax=Stenotrophomonas sp. 278 TaxID=2479851 RepID=UPI001C8B2BF0|nr:NADP-dependent oxidoreductase [Stenotrophomonas sp. 278]